MQKKRGLFGWQILATVLPRRSHPTLQPLLPRSIRGGLVAYLARNAETGAGGSSYSQ